MTEWAIRAEGLVKTYGTHRALDGIDLSVRAGTVHAVLGPNGAGKTTAVRVLSTLTRADGGTAQVFGHDIARSPTAVRSLIGLTGQYASLDELLTARENLFVFARLVGLGRREARSRAAELLERFSLTDAAHRSVSTFSGGMRRRLDIAASLLGDPPLLFLDEPTTGLDPRTRADMWVTVRELVDQGCTVLLTTQYLEEADQLADRIAVIDRGRVVADDTSEALKSSVGGLTLHLQIADSVRRGEAAHVLERITGHQASTADGGLGVRISSGAVTSDVVLALRERAIDIGEITVSRPSMDDVFFALTGAPGTLRRAAA
jgi:ABC-2 type transport system ATP-binding protein